MKLLALLGLASLTVSIPNEECSQDLEVLCIDDIDKAYPVCEKAAH